MKQGKTPEERFIKSWQDMDRSQRLALAHTVIASGYIASTSEDLMTRRSARIIFTVATIAAYCLIFYLAPQLPREMVGWAILLTLGLTLITGYIWLFSREKNGNNNNGE